MDTLWMTYGYRGHMGSGISLSIGEVKVMLGVTTNDTIGGKVLISHDGLLRFVQFRLLFREAAGYLNTVVGPPADFPFRVLYSCALPGHKPTLSRTAGQ